jgi:hypothetical protein
MTLKAMLNVFQLVAVSKTDANYLRAVLQSDTKIGQTTLFTENDTMLVSVFP